MSATRDSATAAELLATARTVRVDRVTAEVVDALRERAVPCVLLRGPVLARWLYDDRELRLYVDADLLVPHTTVPTAEDVLSRRGFERGVEEVDLLGPLDDSEDRRSVMLTFHAQSWARGNWDHVDLHHTLVGARVAPGDVWRVLTTETERLRVRGVAVDVPGPAARAVTLALHAAQHGVGVGKPLEDLRRALERLQDDVWEQAALLADRLDATPSFATGLRLLPAGQDVAQRLELPHDRPLDVALLSTTPPPMAHGFHRLVTTRGARGKFRLAARKLVPSRGFMRHWSPTARRGGLGLVAAYLWRPLWLMRHTVPGLRALLRARRTGGG